MSSFRNSISSKGIGKKIRKSLSFSLNEGTLGLNDTRESSSVSSNGGNHSGPLHVPTQSFPENEKETKDKVSTSLKKFRKSFSAGMKLNQNKYESNSQPSDVLSEASKKTKIKNAKKKKKSTLNIAHDEYGESDPPTDNIGSRLSEPDDDLSAMIDHFEVKREEAVSIAAEKKAAEQGREAESARNKAEKESTEVKAKQVAGAARNAAEIEEQHICDGDVEDWELGEELEDVQSELVPIIKESAEDTCDSSSESDEETEETGDSESDESDSDSDEESQVETEEIGTSPDMPALKRTSSLKTETNSSAVNLIYGTSDDAESHNSDVDNNTTVHEFASDSGSDFSDAETDESQVQLVSPSDHFFENVEQAQCDILSELFPIAGKLGVDSQSGFSETDSDEEVKTETEQTNVSPGGPIFKKTSSLKAETNVFAVNLMYGSSNDSESENSEIGYGKDSDSPGHHEEGSSCQVEMKQDILPSTKGVLLAGETLASDRVEVPSAALWEEVEGLQNQLEQQQRKFHALKRSAAEHKANSIKQKDQISLYKGMFEDLQEDYDMVLVKYNDQVEQTAQLLGLVGTMKERARKYERILVEKLDNIEELEKQISILQQSDQSQELSALKDENENLQKMVDLQKQTLYQIMFNKK